MDKNSLPQYKELIEFINEKGCSSVGFCDTSNSHDLNILIVNSNYISLQELTHQIVSHSKCARQYFYIAVNKFLVYSTADNYCDQHIDPDRKLIQHCQQAIDSEFNIIKYSYNSADNGTFGNFIHPVTYMFFSRHA
jgi:hypothetical protein